MKTLFGWIALGFSAIIFLSVGLVLYYPKNSSPPHSADNVLVISDTPEREGPRFERVYTLSLPGGRVARAMFYTYYTYDSRAARLLSSATLTQEDGRFVTFDTSRIADKILDESLIPFLQEFRERAVEADLSWWEARPSSYTDVRGTRWVREKQDKTS